ncbi:ABC transporter substrate-binding protein, partial [Extibacter sp. GGCC_0201]
EWEWIDDTHCRFKLRDDVTMTDGTLLEAEDVVYDCNELWVGLNATNDIGKYLVGATAEDEHTVVIEFNTAAPD